MTSVDELKQLAKLIRYNIVTSTTEAQSGHATSALSAVELLTTLFFGGYFRQNLESPHELNNDKFILSKGHSSPLLYSIYQAAGVVTREELLTLRKYGSPLEGHPTPRFKYADVATGSLGQGLSIGLGMALGINLKITNYELRIKEKPNIFVLMGDSEFAEGQIYEALQLASHYKASNLIGILDVNRLGQRGQTMLGWDIETYAKRAESFGWHVEIIEDGHNIEEINSVYEKVIRNSQSVIEKPKLIIAKTIKGKGFSIFEDQENWHGKPIPKEQLQDVLKELGEVNLELNGQIAKPQSNDESRREEMLQAPTRLPARQSYTLQDPYSTREAYGDALVLLGQTDPNLVVLDAETSNSTYSEKFKSAYPDRFFEMYIAEQNMISVALGMSKVGLHPFVSTFAAFLSRGFDQIRMAQYSDADIKFCGSHAGISIGEDGPSQMGLEDISMMRSILNSVVIQPSDAISTIKLMQNFIKEKTIGYIRTIRPKTPIIYSDSEEFNIGESKILHQSEKDKAVVFACGISVHETLKAYDFLQKDDINIAVIDMYSIKPLDYERVKQFAHLPIVIVEDHYPYGALGEAIGSYLTRYNIPSSKCKHLCVKSLPRSGSTKELLHHYEIDSEAIIQAVKNLIIE